MLNLYKKNIFLLYVFILCFIVKIWASTDFIKTGFIRNEENLFCQNDDSDDSGDIYQEPEQDGDNGGDTIQPPSDDSQDNPDNSESE